MNAICHGFGRSQDQSSPWDLERAGEVSFSSPDCVQLQADELICSGSGCLCSKSPVSGWTWCCQDFYMLIAKAVGSPKDLLTMFQDSSEYGNGVDRCFNSGSGVELLPTISTEHVATLWKPCALRIILI